MYVTTSPSSFFPAINSLYPQLALLMVGYVVIPLKPKKQWYTGPCKSILKKWEIPSDPYQSAILLWNILLQITITHIFMQHYVLNLPTSPHTPLHNQSTSQKTSCSSHYSIGPGIGQLNYKLNINIRKFAYDMTILIN